MLLVPWGSTIVPRNRDTWMAGVMRVLGYFKSSPSIALGVNPDDIEGLPGPFKEGKEAVERMRERYPGEGKKVIERAKTSRKGV